MHCKWLISRSHRRLEPIKVLKASHPPETMHAKLALCNCHIIRTLKLLRMSRGPCSKPTWLQLSIAIATMTPKKASHQRRDNNSNNKTTPTRKRAGIARPNPTAVTDHLGAKVRKKLISSPWTILWIRRMRCWASTPPSRSMTLTSMTSSQSDRQMLRRRSQSSWREAHHELLQCN